MIISRNLLMTIIVVMSILCSFSLLISYYAARCSNEETDEETHLRGTFLIIGVILFMGAISLFDVSESKTGSVLIKQYEIIQADNDKSIKGSGTRYRFDISSKNEFNFYYKENNAIQHKTINFDFPIYEDANSVYLEEYSYKVMESCKLFWLIELKTYVSEEKEYKLHIPEGQFEKQNIEFN